MKIIVAGGTGLLGEPLVRNLTARGDEVVVLSRNPSTVRAGRGVAWDARTIGEWAFELDGADAVINLAGENIGAGRWTDARKRRLLDSRVNATRTIVDALLRATARKRTLINASAVGYYGYDRDDPVDESSPNGRGFLADLAARWEGEARKVETAARLVIVRFGVVLARDGGALPKMMLPFRVGAGGPVGHGRQWFSWVDRDDVLRALLWALDRDDVRGIYNITSPQPVTNGEFAKKLGNVLHRPSFMPAPAFALRLALGDMAVEALLGGQRALPRRAEEAGFQFQYATVDDALRHVLIR